jgi:3-hydroxy-9,10-secoandrosta-1,3,5(10)-triene-9,17-dione monooxygenase reductase component
VEPARDDASPGAAAAPEPTVPVSDPAQFRHVLGHFCSGITIISSTDGTTPVGLTCQSFFSVSLEPPLVAFSVSSSSRSYPAIRSAGTLVVNILSSSQDEISRSLGRPGSDRWRGIAWSPSPVYGHPVIDGVVAFLECRIEQEVECGDHILVIARVQHLEATRNRTPLLYFRSQYHRLEVEAIADALQGEGLKLTDIANIFGH